MHTKISVEYIGLCEFTWTSTSLPSPTQAHIQRWNSKLSVSRSQLRQQSKNCTVLPGGAPRKDKDDHLWNLYCSCVFASCPYNQFLRKSVKKPTKTRGLFWLTIGSFQSMGSSAWLMGLVMEEARGIVEPFTSCPGRKTKIGRNDSPLPGYMSKDL